MGLSEEGFLRPTAMKPLSEADNRLIGEICPGINLVHPSDGRVRHMLWGPYQSVQGGYAVDGDFRHMGSSGGVLSALLWHLIETQKVDFVLQVAADESSPIENTVIQSHSREDILSAAGSRYGPSAPLADLDRYLDAPGTFALVGKPCDIAAVRAMARHDRRISQKIPLLLSFFCAGIPSLEGTREILRKMEVDEAGLATFRYRGEGWPGSAVATTRQGRIARMSYAESWGDILSKHVQFRCKICPDGTGGFADIVCGDAWDCDDEGYPLFEELDGISLIMARTATGQRLLDDAVETGRISICDLDVDALDKMQPGQSKRKRLVLSRLAAMGLLRRGRPNFSGFDLYRCARSAGWLANIRSFLGMIRRLVLLPRHKGF